MNLFNSVVTLSNRRALVLCAVAAVLGQSTFCFAQDRLENLPVNNWVKLSPLDSTPPSPTLGYEGACAWDSKHQRLLRYGGHNQGGGGEQNSEMWAFEPSSARWQFFQPNLRPPGICCGQQNIFDPITGRYLRFPAFSHSHGWQWFREVYLNNSSVWSFDLDENKWREMRPLPAPHPQALRCASWDSEHQVLVLFAGEASHEGTWVYDPSRNEWTEMNPPEQPAFRSAGNMAYDSHSKLHILFGSQYQDDRHTWAYDLSANRWVDKKPETMPPTKNNDAVLAYDPINKVVLAVVKSAEDVEQQEKDPQDPFDFRLETWSYSTTKNAWQQMQPPQEPDPSGDRARQLMFAPTYNAFLLENRASGIDADTVGEQQIWAYRFAEQTEVDSLQPPLELSLETQAESVALRWKNPSANQGKQAEKFRVFRGTGKNPWSVEFQQLAEVNGSETSYVDQTVKPETIYHYYLTSVADSKESLPSLKVKTQPPVVDALVVSVLGTKHVALHWAPSQTPDIVGYHIERAVVEVYSEDELVLLKPRTPPLDEPSVGAFKSFGEFRQATAKPVVATKWEDRKIDLSKPMPLDGDPIHVSSVPPRHLDPKGKPYRFAVFAYRIRGVNRLGCRGGPSPAVLTVPAPIEQLFASEDETTCKLRWNANQEQGISGYRVYRLDGRWDEVDAVSRLTPDTIDELTYEDTKAAKKTRRYHVLAVDALGQEGQPSPPVWFDRRWKRYYTPFLSDWHQ